jgi:6-phosphogluconolactonase
LKGPGTVQPPPGARHGLHVAADAAAAVADLAELVIEELGAAVAARGRARLALAGGRTPARLHQRLAQPSQAARVPWSAVQVFFGDERCVAPEAPESNLRAARETLLEPLGLGPSQVFAIDGTAPPAVAAADYAARLGPEPLDLVLLGVGDDGHTASLFPGGPELAARAAVVATRSPRPPTDRVSLSLPTLRAARRVAFLVLGADKAPAVAAVWAELALPLARGTLPAALVTGEHSPPLWFVDRAAVRGLR